MINRDNHKCNAANVLKNNCYALYARVVAQYGSSWHTSSATIVSSYSAFSKHKATADIGGYIGLMHINITYRRKYRKLDI